MSSKPPRINPYAPMRESSAQTKDETNFRGFLRGALGGARWSTPIALVIGVIGYLCTQSVAIAVINAFQIPLVWCTVSGCVCMIEDAVPVSPSRR